MAVADMLVAGGGTNGAGIARDAAGRGLSIVLYDDASENASAVTRDYVLDLDAGPGRPALLSIFDGKITTFRKLAEHALERLAPRLPGGTMGRPVRPGPARSPGLRFRRRGYHRG